MNLERLCMYLLMIFNKSLSFHCTECSVLRVLQCTAVCPRNPVEYTVMSCLFTVAPSAPTAPVVSNVSRDSCCLTWQPPERDGGSPVTGYHVERRSNTSKRWVFISKEPISNTVFDVKDLYFENEYTFRVSAENKAGCGPPSQPSEPIMAKDPWGESETTTVYADSVIKVKRH